MPRCKDHLCLMSRCKDHLCLMSRCKDHLCLMPRCKDHLCLMPRCKDHLCLMPRCKDHQCLMSRCTIHSSGKHLHRHLMLVVSAWLPFPQALGVGYYLAFFPTGTWGWLSLCGFLSTHVWLQLFWGQTCMIKSEVTATDILRVTFSTSHHPNLDVS